MAGKHPKKANGKLPEKRKSRGSTSKAESMTGAKENAVEMRKASELPVDTVQIDRKDFDFHFNAAKSDREIMKRYQGKFRERLAAAKKVSPHLAEAVKLALKVENADPEEIRAILEVNRFVLDALGCSTQLILHDTLLGDAKEQAYARGFKDGEAGRSANNRYPEKSEFAEQYMTGWRNGQAKLLGVNVNDRNKHVKAAEARADGPNDPDEGDGSFEEGDEPEEDDGDAPVPMELAAH